jgi:4-amino-4-deoxy-L-arabinose transferase-like glycosyltransferase
MNPEVASRRLRKYGLFTGAIFIALAVRLYLLGQYHCISSDGIHYIEAARHFYDGDVAAGLASVYPPGYPGLIASFYPVVGDWERAGQLVSVVCGVLLLFPLYALCKELYGDKVALLACLLATISPYLARYAAHVRSESPFVLLSTVAVLVLYRGFAHQKIRHFFYGGLVAGLAYLVRPESIGFLMIVPIVLLLTGWIKRERSLMWNGYASLLLFVGFFLFALPYIYYLSSTTGQWGVLSKKTGITLGVSLTESGLLKSEETQTFVDLGSLSFLQFVSRHPLLYIKKVLLDLFPSIGTYFEAVYFSYVPFLLVGLMLILRKRFWLRKEFFLVGFIVFYIVGFALIYVNLRYSVQLVPISLAWVALGGLWCWTRLKRAYTFQTFRTVAIAAGLIFMAATLPKTLSPIAPEKAHVRQAGRYIKTLKGSETFRVFVFDDRITFYGDVKAIFLSDLDERKLLEKIRQRDAFYLATELKPWREHFPRIASDPERYGLIVAKEFPVLDKDRLVVFRVS